MEKIPMNNKACGGMDGNALFSLHYFVFETEYIGLNQRMSKLSDGARRRDLFDMYTR